MLGVVFYLMEEVDGFNPGNEMAQAYVDDADHAARRRPGLRGEPGAAGRRRHGRAVRLRPSGGRDPFWRARFRSSSVCSRATATTPTIPGRLPAVTELAEWLEDNRPDDGEPGIMHGDAHLNNVLLRRDRPELAAFIDWEMCTVGDPLLDLGWMMVCWPTEPNTIDAGAELAALGGPGESQRTARRVLSTPAARRTV